MYYTILERKSEIIKERNLNYMLRERYHNNSMVRVFERNKIEFWFVSPYLQV